LIPILQFAKIRDIAKIREFLKIFKIHKICHFKLW